MLRDLIIRDILLIEHLELEFHPGLNVLTGETGAGKSILLDSLGLALGWRGRAEVVRAGASQGEVTAVFDLGPDHPARAVLDEGGFDPSDELILRRVTSADGRKKAFVNDRRASGEVLRALSDTLVELHGQSDDRGLLDPRAHRDLLDAFGGHGPAVSAARVAWRDLRSARTALAEAKAALDKAAEDAEFLAHAVKEMSDLAPQEGEDAELDGRRRLMQAAEKVREDVARAQHALGNDGAQGKTVDALRWLEDASAASDGHLAGPVAALERALSEMAEAERGVEDALRELDYNPTELEHVEERLFAIRALARKHNCQPDALPALALDFAARAAAIEAGDAHLEALSAAVREAEAAYDGAALKLSGLREKSAKRLDKAMGLELAPLKMERAVFETSVTSGEPGPGGSDAVFFQVATNPGAPAGALGKIASGGELSRFLLALKVCLTEASSQTMIFDEIDRGVGGATADAVGRRLAQLSEKGQVLVVTHSPQVAAFGAHHWQVSKAVMGGQTRTNVAALGTQERVDEIARMLAGDVVSDAARSAAKVLLDG